MGLPAVGHETVSDRSGSGGQVGNRGSRSFALWSTRVCACVA